MKFMRIFISILFSALLLIPLTIKLAYSGEIVTISSEYTNLEVKLIKIKKLNKI